MNLALTLFHKSSWRQPIAARRKQLQPLLTTYWPLMLLVTGFVWLVAVLAAQPLEERLTRYTALLDASHQVQAPLAKTLDMAGRTLVNTNSEAYRAGRLTGALAAVLLTVLLPYLLLLTAIGHYKYWYVTRTTLLTMGKGGKWIYALSLFLLFFILLGISLSAFGRQAARIGIAEVFPFLTVGYLVLYSMLVHVGERQREEKILTQARRQAELDALKAQVNPPFLFHALQGLHQTALDEHLPRTAQSLEQLTGIMQYVLEESRKQTTEVAREIEFIRDYLRLQQLRLPERDTIQVTVDVDWDEKPAHIVPLLLNPLIENTFKYGISIQHPCFVTIRLSVLNDVLTFMTENSILPRHALEKGTGLGLKNVRRRLELAYPSRHKLTVTNQDDVYKVVLKVKLN